MKTIPLSLSRSEFADLATQGNLIPVYTEFVADYETPVSAFEKIDDGKRSFLFESAEINDHVGRYSFLGSSPAVHLESRGRSIRLEENGEVRIFETAQDPLAEMRAIMDRYRFVSVPGLPPFTGGAVGYLGYDVVRFFESTVAAPPPDALGVPDSVMMITDVFLVFDHRYRRLKVVANGDLTRQNVDEAYDMAAAKITTTVAKLQTLTRTRPMNAAPVMTSPQPQANTTREEFHSMVRTSKEYIKAGDIFQIVPSQRFQAPFAGDALSLYRALRFVNPSPYLFCLRLAENFAVVGSSPEVHVRLNGRKAEIRPLAGTSRRGATMEEDQRLASDLLRTPKERAEHVMLVDLARNDLGRICRFGSVKVSDFMTIERYSHVMHIVSNVEGEIADGYTADDVMRATFPAGTVSGAPKVRAMQIINELEKNKRGIYAGAICYFGFDGNLDSCIALRTVVLKDGVAYAQAGGGVVAESEPEGEYQESVNKATALFRAIERARDIL